MTIQIVEINSELAGLINMPPFFEKPPSSQSFLVSKVSP